MIDPKLTQNMEDYLETIYRLDLQHGHVRVKDIAQAMDITMPSVSGAIKNLERDGLVTHPRYDAIALTPSGAVLAEQIYRRHRIIKSFLSQVLGLDQITAERDACSMEHNISPETVDRLAAFIDKTVKHSNT